MDHISRLKKDYPWIQTPLVVGAPMRLIALADMAVEISKAGGIGFIGAGTDTSDLSTHLSHATSLLSETNFASSPLPTLPIGIGFINWGADITTAIPLIQQYKPCAVWFFAPSSLESLHEWTVQTRKVSPETKIWVQVGSVRDAMEAVGKVGPDVLVVQGTDAGGHGLVRGAGLISLVPEVCDAVGGLSKQLKSDSNTPTVSGVSNSTTSADPIILAAGGISESRSASAAFLLGASGIVLGTRLLASPEANISQGYKNAILRASDGGQSTVRTKVYDNLRGTTGWAETHNARGVINKSYFDAMGGMNEEENKRLYEMEMGIGDEGWSADGRMTTYAGSGVGLVREIKGVGEIVREVREGVSGLLEGARSRI